MSSDNDSCSEIEFTASQGAEEHSEDGRGGVVEVEDGGEGGADDSVGLNLVFLSHTALLLRLV